MSLNTCLRAGAKGMLCCSLGTGLARAGTCLDSARSTSGANTHPAPRAARRRPSSRGRVFSHVTCVTFDRPTILEGARPGREGRWNAKGTSTSCGGHGPRSVPSPRSGSGAGRNSLKGKPLTRPLSRERPGARRQSLARAGRASLPGACRRPGAQPPTAALPDQRGRRGRRRPVPTFVDLAILGPNAHSAPSLDATPPSV